MIVLCPKAFAGFGNLIFERQFLNYYLSKTGERATIANEVWDAFRFRHHRNSPNKANQIIANMRGNFKPENLRLKTNFEEVDPVDSADEEMREKTKSLVERRWAEIEFFITEEPELYTDLRNKPKILTLSEFLYHCMNDISKREIVESYSKDTALNKYQ